MTHLNTRTAEGSWGHMETGNINRTWTVFAVLARFLSKVASPSSLPFGLAGIFDLRKGVFMTS